MHRKVLSILNNQTYGDGGGGGGAIPHEKKLKTSNRATDCSSWILLFNYHRQLQAFILYPALCTSLVFWLHPGVNISFRLALQYFVSPNLSEMHYFLNCIPTSTNIS
jgi:hypothetical protein